MSYFHIGPGRWGTVKDREPDLEVIQSRTVRLRRSLDCDRLDDVTTNSLINDQERDNGLESSTRRTLRALFLKVSVLN